MKNRKIFITLLSQKLFVAKKLSAKNCTKGCISTNHVFCLKNVHCRGLGLVRVRVRDKVRVRRLGLKKLETLNTHPTLEVIRLVLFSCFVSVSHLEFLFLFIIIIWFLILLFISLNNI